MPDLTTLLHFLVQILTLWLCALALGLAAQKTGLPAMTGEIAAGLLLGPSCLGFFSPGLFEALFQAGTAASDLRQYSVKFALLCFLFYAGLETGLHSLKNASRPAIAVSAAGMAVPFAAGLLAVFAAPAWWSNFAVMPAVKIAIFLGTALSISALPVIARIFMDLKMLQTQNAAVVMTAATLNDLAGWIILSVILLSERHANIFYEFIPLGAFWAGMLGSGFLKKHVPAMKYLSVAVMGFFAPVYFASIGLRVDFITSFNVTLTAVIFLIACVAKTGGVYAGGLLGGLNRKDSFVVAASMNARGAMEILLATLALEAGLIGNSFFVALVFMAVTTTLVTVGVLRKQALV